MPIAHCSKALPLVRVKFNYCIIHLIYPCENNEGAGKMNLLTGWWENMSDTLATFLSGSRFLDGV